jgi:hypothetical protein
VFSGFSRALGNVGFARSVFPDPPLSPDIVAAPSIATIAAPLSGTLRCNNAGAPAADESAARTL